MTCCCCSQSLLCLLLSHLNLWKRVFKLNFWCPSSAFEERDAIQRACLRAARRLPLLHDVPAVEYISSTCTRYTPRSTSISSGTQKKQKTWEVNCTRWTLYLAVGFFNGIVISDVLGAQALLVHFWMQSKPWVTPLWKLWKLFTPGTIVQCTVASHYHRYFGKTTGTSRMNSQNWKASLRNTGDPHQNTPPPTPPQNI